jgi:hypothetical protein
MLPERPLDCVANYLSFSDICAWSCTCSAISAFVGNKLSTIASLSASVLVSPVCATSTASVLRRCHTLTDLNLQGVIWVDDTVLCSIAEGCPLLSSMNLAKSSITDDGVRALSNSRCASKLHNVVIICCENTTYLSALLLYAAGGEKLLVWRIPQRCSGIYHCPWGEQHVYYSDGSFDYQRDDLTVGWVSHVADHGDESRYGMTMINTNPIFQGVGVLMQFDPKDPKTKTQKQNDEALLNGLSRAALNRLGFARDQQAGISSDAKIVTVGWKNLIEAAPGSQNANTMRQQSIPTRIPAGVELDEGEMVGYTQCFEGL